MAKAPSTGSAPVKFDGVVKGVRTPGQGGSNPGAK